MTNNNTENINISSFEKFVSPEEIKAQLPLQDDTLQKVSKCRQNVRDILDRKDHRLVVIGPHSFLGVDPQANVSVVHTAGNPYAHHAVDQFTVVPS